MYPVFDFDHAFALGQAQGIIDPGNLFLALFRFLQQ